MTKITGDKLIEWGFIPGPSFGLYLKHAKDLCSKGLPNFEVREQLVKLQEEQDLKDKEENINKLVMRTKPQDWEELIDVTTNEEKDNLFSVRSAIIDAMCVPVIKKGVILPDACPTGVAPVGSVLASEMIHPGLHSSDICCSLFATVMDHDDNIDINASLLIDAAKDQTHFGVGTNPLVPDFFKEKIRDSFPKDNFFLMDLENKAVSDLGTQGDGNHFLFVGKRQSDGKLTLVTHHGSRGFGAEVYKRGIKEAKKYTATVAKGMDSLSWLDPSTDLGKSYWEALQYIRFWTYTNHLCIHYLVQQEWSKLLPIKEKEIFWNEHNFVFKKEDGLFYHAKGATPNWKGFAKDDSGKTLVPLNMGEPILILSHTDNDNALGFAPHGAGRNMSRTKFIQNNPDVMGPEGVEVRFYSGKPDLSELPSAYKDANYIIDHIERYNIGEISDRIDPLASLMAGEFNWKIQRKRKERKVK